MAKTRAAQVVAAQGAASLPEVELLRESLSAWGSLMAERAVQEWRVPELPDPIQVPGRENHFVLKAFADVVPGVLVVTHLAVEVPAKGPAARVTAWLNGVFGVVYEVWNRDGVLRSQRPRQSWKREDGRWDSRSLVVASGRGFHQIVEELVVAAAVKVLAQAGESEPEAQGEIPY